MKRLVLCFLIVLDAIVLSAQDIKVLTYNIRFASADSGLQNWEGRKGGVLRILKGYDFIGLQEVLPIQMREIQESFKGIYNSSYRTREADPSKGEGCPILYDATRWEQTRTGYFWLSATPDNPGSNTWGAAFSRMVSYGIFKNKVSGDSLLVINTHFDHVNQIARLNSIDLILTKFRQEMKSMPVVFMGDLNVTPDNEVYKRILSLDILTDSYQKMHPDEPSKGATFHGWKSDIPTERIDYIFVSEFLDVKSSSVLMDRYNGSYPSDHFPVQALFTIK